MQAARADDVQSLLSRIEDLEAQVRDLEQRVPEERACFLVLSDEMESVQSALMAAHATASLGLQTSMYFALWGVQVLRAKPTASGKSVMGKAMSMMLASDVAGLSSARLNFGGLGPKLFYKMMQDQGIQTPAQLLEMVPELGIELIACPLSLGLFELRPEELVADVEIKGMTSYQELASRARIASVF